MKLFSLKLFRRPPKRYAVRKADAPRFIRHTRRTFQEIFEEIIDTHTGKAVGSLGAKKEADACFAHVYAPQNPQPYVYDILLGTRVFSDTRENCVDRAALLNQEWEDSQKGNADWMGVAHALVRARLLDTPSGWYIKEDGNDGFFDVLSSNGATIARCTSYGEAAHVVGLSDYVLHLTETYAPRGQSEL